MSLRCLIICAISLVATRVSSNPICPLESSCGVVNESAAVCHLDDKEGCIRKYSSKCHLEIAACQEGINYTDYSNLYCSMETYLCELNPTYARWTIFFGFEKD